MADPVDIHKSLHFVVQFFTPESNNRFSALEASTVCNPEVEILTKRTELVKLWKCCHQNPELGFGDWVSTLHYLSTNL